jgi:hypothetical protein
MRRAGGTTVKFALLMYADPAHTKAMTSDERGIVARKHAALRDELTESGELLDGAGLAYPADTTTFRFDDGAVAASPGPLTTDTVQLTAYYLLRCADEERARAIAAHILDFHVTAVEVRPVHDSAHPD